MTELANIPSAKELRDNPTIPTRPAGRPPRVYGPSPDSIHIYGTGASGTRSRLQTIVIKAKKRKKHKEGACPCLNCTMQRNICAEDKKAVCAHDGQPMGLDEAVRVQDAINAIIDHTDLDTYVTMHKEKSQPDADAAYHTATDLIGVHGTSRKALNYVTRVIDAYRD